MLTVIVCLLTLQQQQQQRDEIVGVFEMSRDLLSWLNDNNVLAISGHNDVLTKKLPFPSFSGNHFQRKRNFDRMHYFCSL